VPEVRVLYLAANPIDTPRMRLDQEIRAISEKVRGATSPRQVVMIPWFAVRPDDLLQALNETTPHVVHFSGHGTQGKLFLEDPSGKAKAVTEQALGQLFETMHGNIRVVVLNACYAHSLAAALAQVVDCAIGTDSAITDPQAIIFAGSFYRAIAFGRSVYEAYRQGRAALELEGVSGAQPELLSHPGVNPASIVLLEGVAGESKKRLFDIGRDPDSIERFYEKE